MTPSPLAGLQAMSGTWDSIDAQMDAQIHAMHRESTGTAIDDYDRVVCSCGWKGPKRHGYDDWQCTNLREDELSHRLAARLDSSPRGTQDGL